MKIFKLFVCLLLILSTSSVNSLAAISVSDGSAFVTKAEFAADLNNLSNRMSSLENSLDAKIDSLVSSYLSRNGIWNGEKQNVNILYFNTRKGMKSSAVVIEPKNAGEDNLSSAVFNSEMLDSTITFSKSGLTVLKYNFTNEKYFNNQDSVEVVDETDNGNSYEYLQFNATKSRQGTRNAFYPISSYINLIFYLADKNGSNFVNLDSCLSVQLSTLGAVSTLNYVTNAGETAYGFYNNLFQSNYGYFFTSKDKCLVLKTELFYKIGSTNLADCKVTYVRIGKIPSFSIEDCIVY